MDNPFIAYSLLLVFFSLQGIIIWKDLTKRIIPNVYLLGLACLLPIWMTIYPPQHAGMALIFACIPIVAGIALYRQEDGFLGSGDLKYLAILLLFTRGENITLFIQNIGVITIMSLIFLWGVLLGGISTLPWRITRESFLSVLPGFKPKGVIGWIMIFVLDWCVIGFLLFLLIPKIMLYVFQVSPSGTDLYFFVTLVVILLRTRIRHLLLDGKYSIYLILAILLYGGSELQVLGQSGFLGKFEMYIVGTWIFVGFFTIISILVRSTFSIHGALVKKAHLHPLFDTFPFSVIIFLSFVVTYFLHISILGYFL